MKFNKALLIPIITLVFFVLKRVFGIEFNSQEIDLIVEGIMALLVASGLAMKPKK